MPMEMGGALAALDKWQPKRCSVALAMDVVGTKTGMLLLREAFYGTTRFHDFVRRVGVTEAVAAKRLREFVAAGIFAKRPYQEPGQRVRDEYVLTDMGAGLLPVVMALMQWGDAHLQPDGGPLRVVDRADGRPVRVEVRSAGGELGPEQLRVVSNRAS